MTQPNTILNIFDVRAPEYLKLRKYLIGWIAHELEGNAFREADRNRVVQQYLEQGYTQAKVTLHPTIKQQLFRDITDELVGFGAIQPLLDDPDITEVMVNGWKNVYIERAGKVIRTDINFENDEAVLKLIDRIILPMGRRIDADSPTVDARLPDGSRVNAVIPPVAIDGPSITIRKFGKGKLTLQQLIEYGSMTQMMGDFMKACVVTRLNVIVSGGTGSGKTTFLNMLSSFIPFGERIVTIEDAAELRLQQEHVVRLETKTPNIDGTGAVVTRDLVRNSLRMRPDRIIVGEVRGGEALDMLQAMNTGHDGSMTTIHANSPRDALSRLETLCMMAGMEIPLKNLREQIASAIDLIIQLSRIKDGSRRVVAVTEVAGMEGDTIVLTDLYKFTQTGVTQEGKVLGEIKPTGIRPLFTPRLEAAGFKLNAEIFGANLNDFFTSPRRR